MGNSRNEETRVFFERIGWKNRDFSPIMYYSNRGALIRSTAPRSTNVAIEVISEK